MAKATSKAAFLAKLKRTAKGGWKKARGAEPKIKGAQLPDGLINAVAQVSSYKLDLDKKGNPYITITGIAKDPEEIRGQRVPIQHFLRPGRDKTVEDKLAELSSNLQLLGCDTEGTDEDDIPGLLETLVRKKPHFKFNTWRPPATKDYPSPSTIVFVQGLAEDWEGDEEETEEEEEPFDEDDSEEEEEDESDEDDSDEDLIPEKGEVYLYQSSAKTRPAECEVTTVQKSRETVTLKRVKDNKVFKDVAWEKLSIPE